MIQLQKNKEIRGCPTPPTNNLSSDAGRFKNFVQFLLRNEDVSTLLHLRNIIVFGIVIELVSSKPKLFHSFPKGIVAWSCLIKNSFSCFDMFGGIVAFTLDFLSGDIVVRGEVVDGCQRHIESFLYLYGCTPFFDMRGRSLFSKIGIYVPFAPIGLASVISSGDVLSLGYCKKGRSRYIVSIAHLVCRI